MSFAPISKNSFGSTGHLTVYKSHDTIKIIFVFGFYLKCRQPGLGAVIKMKRLVCRHRMCVLRSLIRKRGGEQKATVWPKL